MLLILLLIYWTHFLDLNAKFTSFSGFQIQNQANYLPNNSSFFFIFLLTTIEDLLKLGTSPLFCVLITQ